MRNKTWKYLVVTSAIFVLSACGGGTKKQVNEDVSMDSVNGVCDGPVSYTHLDVYKRQAPLR